MTLAVFVLLCMQVSATNFRADSHTQKMATVFTLLIKWLVGLVCLTKLGLVWPRGAVAWAINAGAKCPKPFRGPITTLPMLVDMRLALFRGPFPASTAVDALLRKKRT